MEQVSGALCPEKKLPRQIVRFDERNQCVNDFFCHVLVIDLAIIVEVVQ